MLLLSIPDLVEVTNLTADPLYVLDIRLEPGVPRTLAFYAVPLLRRTSLWDALVPPAQAGTINVDVAVSPLTNGVYETDRLPMPISSALAMLPATITVTSTIGEDLYIGTYRIPALSSLVIDTTSADSYRTDIWYDLARAVKLGLVTVPGVGPTLNILIDGVESGHRNSGGHDLSPADYADYPAPPSDAPELDFSQDTNSMYVPIVTWI